MEREKLNDLESEKVVGGSIVFNGAHTTCGRDRNDEYRVLDYDAVIQYIAENRHQMSERKMLANMLEAKLLTNLE